MHNRDRTEALQRDLLDALVHLHDPDYQPSELVCQLTRRDSQAGPMSVQAALLEALEQLKPVSDAPSDARAWLTYNVMYQRYVLRLTQEKVAEALGISVRSIHRVQKEGGAPWRCWSAA